MIHEKNTSSGAFVNSFLSGLFPESFFGAALTQNIRSWALTALEKNPGIVGHFLNAPDRLPAPGADERPLMPWYNEFAGKLLTGMAFAYQAIPSEELLQAGSKLASALGAAQGADGYLGVFDEKHRFGGDGENWDLWGHYHSAYGLLCWYKVTGGTDSGPLETARRALDCVYNHFQNRSYDSAGNQTMNLAVSHGFALLYQETGEQRFLDAALQIVEREWPLSGNWKDHVLEGGEFWQCPLPRWEALHAILALGTLYEITGKEEYFTALEANWKSIRKTDRHNTGGFSSGEQAQGTPFATGAIETCCTVAWMALTTEYLRLSKDSAAADELELSLYNGMLGALMPDGRTVAYNTPMCGDGRMSSQEEIGFQYNRFSPDFNCCQANALRGLAQISQWAALEGSDGIFLNFYGGCRMCLKTPGGQKLELVQQTDYPAQGPVAITLALSSPEEFTLLLRIPAWSGQTQVSVNGSPLQGITAGAYLPVRRLWHSGDVIRLNLDMSLHIWKGAEGFSGTASLSYGPLLLVAPRPHEPLNLAEGAKIQPAAMEGNDGWLQFILAADDGYTVLYDFATGSHRGAYTSWLSVSYCPCTCNMLQCGTCRF